MKLRAQMFLLVAMVLSTLPSVAQQTTANDISFFASFANFDQADLSFRLDQRTTAYQHGVFGDDFEFARLVGPNGQELYRPTDKVLEERLVRVMDLNHDGMPEVLLVEANAGLGANLVLVALSHAPDVGWRIDSIARGPEIGIGHRWMNPLEGQVDMDGDGVDEIAAMTTPHIGGPVVVYRWVGERLEPIERIDVSGYSNHRYGDPEQRWSRFFRREDGTVVAELRARHDWGTTQQFEIE